MNEGEHNFQDVKRLLKIKRHEVPPPGYFNSFSSQVVSRIRAGETMESPSFAAQLKESAPWLFDLLRMFEAKPAFVGAGATMVCLLLVFGLVVTEHTDSNPGAFLTASSQSAATPVADAASPAVNSTSDSLASSGIAISTNPVTSLQPMAASFGQPGDVSLFQSAAFSPTGH